ncbi:MAG TPA: hypothetical protein VFJ65_00310 [Solirubrobacterales bacterium]|nr:hypothetical protein [Solirubrobacterales bacterium]
MAAVLAAIASASASAATGQIMRALTTPDWSQASLAGSVTWTGCEHAGAPPKPEEPKEPPREKGEERSAPVDPKPLSLAYCGWTPFVTVGPGTEPSDCASPARQWPDKLGPDVVLAWEGTESRVNGSASFDVSGIPLDGERERLVCLSVVEVAPIYSQVKCNPDVPDCGPSFSEVPFSLPLAAAPLRPVAKKPLRRPPLCRGRRHHRRICVSQHRKVP